MGETDNILQKNSDTDRYGPGRTQQSGVEWVSEFCPVAASQNYFSTWMSEGKIRAKNVDESRKLRVIYVQW